MRCLSGLVSRTFLVAVVSYTPVRILDASRHPESPLRPLLPSGMSGLGGSVGSFGRRPSLSVVRAGSLDVWFVDPLSCLGGHTTHYACRAGCRGGLGVVNEFYFND